jgi:hypothetical protein
VHRTAVLAAAALAVAAASAPAATGPQLLLARDAPLTVAGVRFHAGEHVTVRYAGSGGPLTRAAVAGARGGFVVRFAHVDYDPCTTMSITAVGSDGSRASLRTDRRECPPALPGSQSP